MDDKHRGERRQQHNRRRQDKRQNLLFKTQVAAWLALIASFGTAVAFFDRLHEDYVTRAELYKWILDERQRGTRHGIPGQIVFNDDWQKTVGGPVKGDSQTHGQHH